jgi:transcriptional regulator with XRE-family HTH domain
VDHDKRKALEAAGFRVGDAGDFLELTDAERELVELRAEVSSLVVKTRKRRGLSQAQTAALMGTTQPRVSKIEAGAADVSLDQMFQAFFAIGGRMTDLRRRAPTAMRSKRVAAAGEKARKAALTKTTEAARAAAKKPVAR